MAHRSDLNHIFASEVELRNVLLHIEQDRAEKEEEIEVRCDEEFESEKFREVVTKIHVMEEYYKGKEEKVRRNVIVDNVCLKNVARMERLQKRHEHVLEIVAEVREKIDNNPEGTRYKKLLSDLLLEGLFKLLERSVKVWCRPEDSSLVSSILDDINSEFKEKSGIEATVRLDTDNPIGPETGGGLILVNEANRVSVCNTIESRIQRIVTSMEPLMVYTLFNTRQEGEEGFTPFFLRNIASQVALFSEDERARRISVRTDAEFK